MKGPLSGITVVALEQAIAAPFASRQLADLGARVIKVERPGEGDFARSYDSRTKGLSSHFAWVNRSKESITLDIKKPEAQEILTKLVERADVFVQNLAPGATARAGLDYKSLAKLHPRLIVCDISGYGADGPYEKKKAYDLLVQAEAGFLSVTGTDTEMVKAGCSIADISAGMYAYSSILAALLQRNSTGQGCHIEISMLESMVEWMGFPMYYAFDGALPPPRAGASHATIYPYGPFKAADKRTVILGLQNEREWSNFCLIVLDMPELATDVRFASNACRSENRLELKQIIDDVFSHLDADSLTARLDDAGIANGRLNEMRDVWQHPQLKFRERWRTVSSPMGNLPALLPPWGSVFGERMEPIPSVGSNTETILEELGYVEHDIALLRERGSI